MMRIIKNSLFLSLLFLPLAALAETADGGMSFNFFSPSMTDLSVKLLGAAFGSIGGILPGSGNQLIGTLVGVFNACWVIVIGIGILFGVWESVMHAASSGEMMGGRGRKTAFKICGIVCGVCLVIPSKSTGYSLAQNGVIWVVVQGIGLADQVSRKLHTYLRSGGVIASNEPLNIDKDLKPLLEPVQTILSSEICMYKLKDLKQPKIENKPPIDPNIPQVPDLPNNKLDPIGYSKNKDGSFTFGSLNKDYDSTDSNSYRYNSECGKILMNVDSASLLANPINKLADADPNASPIDPAAIAQYVDAATTDIVINLQPVAREIASVDLTKSGSSQALNKLKSTGSAAMSTSIMNFGVLLDPVRRAERNAKSASLINKLDELNDKGWIFTPIVTALPAMYEYAQVSISNYAPVVISADFSEKPKSVFNELKPQELEDLAALTNRPATDNYMDAGYLYLQVMARSQSFLDFNDFYRGDENVLDGTLDWIGGLAILPLNLLSSVINTVANGGLGVVDDITGGFCDVTDWMGLGNCGGSDFSGAIELNIDIGKPVEGLITSAMGELKGMLGGTNRDLAMGGLNGETMLMAAKSGPITGIIVAMAAIMIGDNIKSMTSIAFGVGPENAMARAVMIGGKIMENSIKSIFKAAQVQTIIGFAEAGATVVGAMLPVGGGLVDFVANLVGQGAKIIIPLYIGFCLLFFSGGVLLYYFLPMIPVFAFFGVVLNWFVMIFLNIMTAPIFCFNLIREGESVLGKGERFLTDLMKTTLTPAILTIGIVVFSILFNIAFALVTSIINYMFWTITTIYSSDILVMVTFTMVLVVFGIMTMYIAQTLATMCTSNAVQVVGMAIGEGIQHVSNESPNHELKQGVSHTGQQSGGAVQKATESKSDMGGMARDMAKKQKEEGASKGGGKGGK